MTEANAILITNTDALINAGFKKRIKYEDADMYKIFSILYGLVIFIGGVAFSISHAIVEGDEGEVIKHATEIYFTCLYWISITWMIFCIIDIVRHQKKVPNPIDLIDKNSKQIQIPSTSVEINRQSSITNELLENIRENQSDDSDIEQTETPDHSIKSNSCSDNLPRRSLANTARQVSFRDSLSRRHAIDENEQQNLITYIQGRKNSIAEHVIGYNYDDNSTAGGLYTRAGLGIFCLGTIIHSSLSILSNLENRACVRWTAIFDDLSRLLFSLIQFFFIFKHSNLIIRAHESFARLAFIHIVVTNLCVWFRMVVIETKSEITELTGHENLSANFGVNGSHFNDPNLPRLLMLDLKCFKLAANGHRITSFIYDGYIQLKPLLYPCTIEFSLMSLTLFFLIWENIGKTFAHKISDKASTKNVFMLNCHASIKGLFCGMIVFSCTIISIILYVILRHKFEDTNLHERNSTRISSSSHRRHLISQNPFPIDYSIAIVKVLNIFLLALSLFATIWSLIKIRKVEYRSMTTRFDDVLIVVSLIGIYLDSIFSAFAIIGRLSTLSWMAYLKAVIIVLGFVEGTCQALFILIALRKHMKPTNQFGYPGREMITLLIMVDLSLWFEETTTTTKHAANPFQLSFYHVIPWSIIAAIATPLQIFFRFHASVCLSHVWANMYRSLPYQPLHHS